ncbi:signal peptidase II [Atopobium fossor]|uniref:signal peptidase II n=1 Tax=Atopobium fossor TaxID=39487 RepID=UPI00041F6D81|nr:signal peptidase II [Atopobium fossor]
MSKIAKTSTLSAWAKLLFMTVVACAVIAFDQVSKACMREYLADGPKPFLPGIIRFVLVQNKGAAFSIGEGSSWLFILFALIVVMAAYVWVARDKNLPLSIVLGLGIVCGGGIGNLIDRVVVGAVTDFIATQFIDFPIFNVADIAISCGIIGTFLLVCHFDVANPNTHTNSCELSDSQEKLPEQRQA